MNNIEPEHYRTGEVDLFESWYLTYPFEVFRGIMESHIDKYIRRDKFDRVEDLEKAIYVLNRLKEYELRHTEELND